MCGFCDVWVCVCVGFVMCGCEYVRVCDVWVSVCVGVSVICVLVFTVFCIVSFMYTYSYLLCLYQCKWNVERQLVASSWHSTIFHCTLLLSVQNGNRRDRRLCCCNFLFSFTFLIGGACKPQAR